MGLIPYVCIWSVYILNVVFTINLEVITLYFIIICMLFCMFYCVDIIVMFVVHMVDKKNWIIDMVWSVGLELIGGEFEPWLEQKA